MTTSASAARVAEFLRPEATAINRLPMRAPLEFYRDAAAALAAKRPRRRLSLDGDWRFQLLDTPTAVPSSWFGGADVAKSEVLTVAVPGCWTRQGVDDLPHYTNIIMPWPGLEAPQTPERNPTGLYRRHFTLAASWLDDDVVVHLGGFESVAAVWCNGIFVGMGKDSRLASEFSLNDAVRAGENRLDIMVIRYSDATWIEDQDHWWHGGLHRSVYVEARPRVRIDDVSVVADFDPATGHGALVVNAQVPGHFSSSVRVTLYDGDTTIAHATTPVPMVPDGPPLEQLVTSYHYPGRVATIELDAGMVRAWTAETPDRYTVVVELVDDRERTTSAHSLMVGFRRVEVRDRRFLVNGVPIVFHGVNRHDHHPDTAKVLTEQDLRDDLLSMKRHNIDALRCAHYPNDPRLLDLCDELGMWVIDEANIECHARLRSIADDTRYLPAFVDRVTRMVQRDRNHPSVIMWSLGNESGHGVSHDACAAWVRAADPTRPIHYEGAVQRRFLVERADADLARQAPSLRERAVTDVVCPMYTAVDVVEAWAEWAESTELDDRPLMLCEYSHAMGNSNGGFDRYAEAFHRLPALAGGFIWDWKDQGLRSHTAEGREFWAYGGHFGDEPNDANFCINGLVGPDGTPHPGLAEVAWGYQPVRVTPIHGSRVPGRRVPGRRVRVENRRSFRDLTDLTGEWDLLIDGVVVEAGSLAVTVAPGTSTSCDVPYTTRLPRGGDVSLHVRFLDGERVVAHDEIVLRERGGDDLAVIDDPGLQGLVVADRSSKTVRVGETSIGWDDRGPHSLVVAGQPVSDRLEPCLWRAPVDNDGVAQGWMSDVSGVRPRWVEQGLDRLRWRVTGTQLLTGDERALVIIDRRVGEETAVRWCTRIVLSADAMVIDEAVDLDPVWADPPRVGSRLVVDDALTNLCWFGLGPHETYPDRRSSGRLGTWRSTVAEQYHPFVVPQEHGAHEATRWFSLADADVGGLRFEAATPVSFSARNHHDDALTRARTLADLETSDGIEVHIDAAQRGLGTGACGPDTGADFRIRAGEHRWRFTITSLVASNSNRKPARA